MSITNGWILALDFLKNECFAKIGYDIEQQINPYILQLKPDGVVDKGLIDKLVELLDEDWKNYFITNCPVAEETIVTSVVPDVAEVADGYSLLNLEEIIVAHFGEGFRDYSKQLNDWYQHQPIKKDSFNYILKDFIPSNLDAETAKKVIDLLEISLQEILITNPTVESTGALENTIDTTNTVNTIPSDIQETTIIQTAEQDALSIQTMDDKQIEEVKDTNKDIKSLQKQINDLSNELLMKKNTLNAEGPFLNDSYLRCPSFFNLIEPIRKVIVKKRELSITKFWYEKYRPELVEEILFPNQPIKEEVQTYVRNSYINGHCMFYGEGGVGKTTTNIVLMNAVLKNASDRFILNRKIESVDDLKGFLNKKPIGRQKIVIAEEFDRLSDAAMTELKNGLLEKYEDTIFLASTNKIHKIDSALLSRFTFVAKFETADPTELFYKCIFILNNERIVYKEEDILKFVETNKLKGIRTILNNLQLSCYDRVFDPNRTSYFIGSSGTEFNLIQWVKYFIYALLQCDTNTLYALLYSYENFPEIKKLRTGIMDILLYNYNLNYDYVYMELLKDPTIFLPVKNILEKYYQDSEFKKIKSMHFEAMLNEITHTIYEFRNIELNWQNKQITDVVKHSNTISNMDTINQVATQYDQTNKIMA